MRRLALEGGVLGATRVEPELLSLTVPDHLGSGDDGEVQLHLRVATIEQLLAVEHVYAALTGVPRLTSLHPPSPPLT